MAPGGLNYTMSDEMVIARSRCATMGPMERLRASEAYWSAQAATFDDEPDHGLADPAVRMA